MTKVWYTNRAARHADHREREETGGDAVRARDPAAGVTRLTVYHQFGSRRGLLEAAFDEVALDPEFGVALTVRNERRRVLLNRLVSRLAPKAPALVRRDAVDLMFALTSQATFAMLHRHRAVDAVARLIKDACRAALPRS